MPKQATTWLEVAVGNAGFRQGIRAVTWAFLWGVARESLGHDPTVEEVAEFWSSSRRTAFRDQASFRKGFPNFETPAPIFEVPEALAAVRRTVKAMHEFEESLRKGTPRIDKAVLQIGMLPAR